MKIVMVHDCAFVGYELRRELLRRVFNVDHLFFSGSAKIATTKMALKLRKLKCALAHARFYMHVERDITARANRVRTNNYKFQIQKEAHISNLL